MGRTTNERAALYAAYKLLEDALKDDGDLPPGFAANLGGTSVTVMIPAGTVISRDPGPQGDGVIKKKATQSLYGYAVWASFLRRLARFNQAGVVRRILMDAWREAMASGTKVEGELREIDPEIASFIDDLKAQGGPMREEQTPRKIARPKAEAVLIVQQPKSGRLTG